MTASISDLLANADGVPSAFNRTSPVGTTVTGQIVESGVRQTTDYETGTPEFWPDGNPKQQVRIVVQTDQRDPARPGDDGRRAIFIKWWGDQRQALTLAVKNAGDTDVRVGGTFTATYMGDKPSDNPRLNAAKLYTYQYVKPATGLDFTAPAPTPVSQAAAWAAPAAPVAPPVPAAAPATPPAPTPAPAPVGGAQDLVDKVKALIGLGLTDEQISAATGATSDEVAALRLT